MAGSNPVALPLLLAVVSLVIAGIKWHSVPHKVPIWWNVHALPIAWAPRWFGLLLLPVLQLLIPYVLYILAVRGENLEGQSGESAYAVANIISLPAIFLFVIFNLGYLEAVTRDGGHYYWPRIFTASVAVWALFWLGYNLQYVEPNSSIGVLSWWMVSKKGLWTQTHQRAAWVLMVMGIVLFILALSCPLGVPFLVVTVVGWFGTYLLVALDSYLLLRDYVEEEGESVSEPLLGQEA